LQSFGLPDLRKKLTEYDILTSMAYDITMESSAEPLAP